MRSSRPEELRRIHLEIREMQEGGDRASIQEKETMLWETAQKVMHLCKLARLEGLLALEEAVEEIPLDSPQEVLKQLIILLVDGTDPEIIEEIGWNRYYAHLYKDYEALRYFIYLEGALSIQAGVNPRVLEEKLKVMLPPKMYLKYSLKQEEMSQEEERQKGEHLIEKLCKGERLWNLGENGYYVSRLVDYVICDITDKELQRVMREVEHFTLALAMKGMSGEARKHIFDNLSERLAKWVAEDIMNMGPVRVVDILEASQKILNILIRLIDSGEIAGSYEYLEPFCQVFTGDTKQQRQKNSKLSQLRKMVEEYEQGADLVREYEE